MEVALDRNAEAFITAPREAAASRIAVVHATAPRGVVVTPGSTGEEAKSEEGKGEEEEPPSRRVLTPVDKLRDRMDAGKDMCAYTATQVVDEKITDHGEREEVTTAHVLRTLLLGQAILLRKEYLKREPGDA
jgi:hypothetical protein